MRVGIGYDSHRFVEDRRLVLGGVYIPHHLGLAGHSDADALLHAIGDALLGAAALGDIGSHFPDTDEQWKNADSRELLQAIVGKIGNCGFCVGNIDATIITEEPKLLPHIGQMRETIAEILAVPVTAVSVKGKTNEKMGFIGRGEGLACLVVALLQKSSA